MKRFFLRGFAVLFPLVVTAILVGFVASFLHGNVGVPIGEAIKWGVEKFAGEDHRESWFFRQGAPLLGFALAILLTLAAGFFIATFIGKKLHGLFERLLRKLPVVGTIYPYARQFTDFLFSADDQKRMDFKHAVAVPFPAYGIYSIGFVTGEGMKALDEATKKHMLCVFVPTAPTPFSGFVIYVAREDVVPLPLTTEEAMRIIISAGVLHPAHQQVAALPPGMPHPAVPEELLRKESGIRNPESR
jgi:uncharacterized membrane protein